MYKWWSLENTIFKKNSFSDIYKEDPNNIFCLKSKHIRRAAKKTETSKNKVS